ncbi:MAG: tRNA (N6-isopentenyl adenosine(37)-C2)-methylthiotransferase MiaB [bacterium]
MKSELPKYHILVLGCQMNRADSERISALLEDWGFVYTPHEDEAGVTVVVACSIREKAVHRVYGKGNKWLKRRAQGKLVTILTGCVLDHDKAKLTKCFDVVLPIERIGEMGKYLPLKITPEVKSGDYLDLPAVRRANYTADVPIMNGCNNFCSYCVVPYVRGREHSRDAKKIIAECQELIAQGYKEINLLGQNVNSYSSGDYDFPKLLAEIDKITGDYWLRFMSSHPKDLSDDLIAVMASGEHIETHLHLAVQSGDTEILKQMNRKYTREHLLNLVSKIKQAIPQIMLSTDVIVGFPGETLAQFKNTVKLFKEVGFDMAYVSEFSPRTGTVAGKMNDNVAWGEKARRKNELNKVFQAEAAKHNKKCVGQVVKVLVDNCKDGRCFAKMRDYKLVVFKGQSDLVGKFVEVKIYKADGWRLHGKLLGGKGAISRLTPGKLVVVVGPTACGKTKIGAQLAHKFDGEIVGADSRQVFRGMTIGTGKDLADYQIGRAKVPYHLIDIVNPNTDFNVSKFQKRAYRAINGIMAQGKLPFLVGGTGLYVDAVTKGYNFAGAKVTDAEIKLIRIKLEKMTLAQLLAQLKKCDPKTFEIIDQKNRRRVQRALEIFLTTGGSKAENIANQKPPYDVLYLGVKFSLEEIYQRIDSRLEARIKEGMVKEINRLRKQGVSWKRLDDFGLEYRFISRYLRGKLTYEQAIEELKLAIHYFAKRQITWFKRNQNIHWITSIQEGEKLVKSFIKK